jgi:hypothetical protein
MRNWQQWLVLIERTRSDVRSVALLMREWQRSGSQSHLAPEERQHLELALQKLQVQSLEHAQQTYDSSLKLLNTPDAPLRPRANLDYRAEGLQGRGRLYIEIDDRPQIYPDDPVTLPFDFIYLFGSDLGFAGLQIDGVDKLIDQRDLVISTLKAIDLPVIDCPEAGLRDVHIVDVLVWWLEHQ